MPIALFNARVLRDGQLLEDHCVLIDGGRIVDVVPAAQARGPRIDRVDLGGGLLLPGFIDTQVNGGGGVLFNDAPSVEAIRQIGRAHRRFGTTGFMPTLISTDLEVVAQAISATRGALAAGVPGVLGIHIEGPFLSVERKGVHDQAKLRELDESAVGLLSSLGAGRTIVTLAPEVTTPEIIQRLANAGVIVSAGHTNATYAEVTEALRHGLRGFTHLFNAMSQLTSREPGAVGAALEDPASWCGIIVDGEHIAPAVLRLALRCKPHERFMLVTDAMPVVVVAPNDALLDKLKSNLQEVRARGGRLYVLTDAGTRIDNTEGVHAIRLPEHYGLLSPVVHVVPLQLLAYHTAVARGTDVDKPRNLAKSVTVE
jgi:N-acetylglucosamine-6-phosphate deacetylase